MPVALDPVMGSAADRIARRDGYILSRVLRDGWDRGDLGTLTKTSPARATGAHISLIGHITADELRDLFGRHRTAVDISRALAALAAAGKAARITRADTGGRAAELWVAAES